MTRECIHTQRVLKSQDKSSGQFNRECDTQSLRCAFAFRAASPCPHPGAGPQQHGGVRLRRTVSRVCPPVSATSTCHSKESNEDVAHKRNVWTGWTLLHERSCGEDCCPSKGQAALCLAEWANSAKKVLAGGTMCVPHGNERSICIDIAKAPWGLTVQLAAHQSSVVVVHVQSSSVRSSYRKGTAAVQQYNSTKDDDWCRSHSCTECWWWCCGCHLSTCVCKDHQQAGDTGHSATTTTHPTTQHNDTATTPHRATAQTSTTHPRRTPGTPRSATCQWTDRRGTRCAPRGRPRTRRAAGSRSAAAARPAPSPRSAAPGTGARGNPGRGRGRAR